MRKQPPPKPRPKKKAGPTLCQRAKDLLLKALLHLLFGPALAIYDGLKASVKFWIRPVDWCIKKIYPEYVNDFIDTRERISDSVKRKAGSGILTLSSFVAK